MEAMEHELGRGNLTCPHEYLSLTLSHNQEHKMENALDWIFYYLLIDSLSFFPPPTPLLSFCALC